ncbi:unnamed protein product [Cylindrotheca closterium]|uniref:Guanylate cyclase domain-containing protein n=1 Tax=Cylindrotheca closterium TaxID=2856 RepID=A0AAD2CMT0_9STRA|nr:unnamed protein product [Cylindrotheca closterium]
MSSHQGDAGPPNGDSKLTGGTMEDYDSVSEYSDSEGNLDAASVHTAKSVKKEEYHGAGRDNRHVWLSMIVVLLMIGATTGVVLGFTNKFLIDEETAEFENGFRQHVSAVAEGTNFHAKSMIGYMESMAETITSYSAASGAQWPLVTVPNFVRRGQRTMDEARLDMVAFSPIVDAKHLGNWSGFVASKSVGSLYEDESKEGNGFPNPDIFEFGSDDISSGAISFVPFWMSSPMPYNVSVVNLNLLSKETYNKAFQSMKVSEQTVLSELYTSSKNEGMFILKEHVFPPSYFDGKVVENDFGIPLNTDGNTEEADGEEVIDQIPHSIIMTPVFDNFDLDRRSMVGVVYSVIPWDKFFINLLPDDVNGIIAVLKDTCGNRYSFVINGKTAAYIGEGDVEGTNNAYISETIDFGQVFAAEGTECVYSLAIYPSENFEALFYSDARTFFMPFFAAVFICLGIGFLLFFWFVERRQRKVVGVAQRTTAIVSSLFPDNVRDRIMQQAEEQANEEAKGKVLVVNEDGTNENLAQLLESGKKQEVPKSPSLSGSSKSGSSKRVRLVGGGRTPRTGGKKRAANGSTDGAPIADRYPHCTVFFADIVGFTSWSSDRDPVQVFLLLETLYGAADKIANRMGVFKVETIGDCYVAVTGLPKPRDDHAIALARFSQKFLLKSRQVFLDLEDALGTSKLDVRIGLHSGPVTAGVLRGEKARFQLFGDTVNTAARMESNSRTGRIHCSKATADLLVEGRKLSWLTERADKIVAKGKGEMITYFIDVPSSDISSRKSGFGKSGSRRSLGTDSSGDSSLMSPATPFKMGSKRGLTVDAGVPAIPAIPRVPTLDSEDYNSEDMGEL